MDCIKGHGPKASEPSLLSDQSGREIPSTRSRPDNRLLKAVVLLLSLLVIVLLALFIWLAVEVRHNKNDIRALKAVLVGTPQSTAVRTASASGAGNASLTETSTAYPAVYLSKAATAQSGYSYAGSLYRGSGYWAAQDSLPTPRADFSALNINETLFVTGGHDADDNYLATSFTYNPLLNLSSNVSDMPIARSHFAAGSIDNRTVHLVGGYRSEANESSNTPEKCSLDYSVASNTWSTGACLVEARGSSCGAVVNGRLFVAGGLGQNGTVLASIEVYDPKTDAWTTFAQLPSGRSDAGCAASGSNLIVAGGANESQADLREVWAVDSNRGNMSRLADLLYARFDLQLVSLPGGGDVLAVGGGQHVNGTEKGLHTVERYSKASNQWVEKAPITEQRFAFGAAFINEGTYALGGHIFCNDTLTEDCGNRVRDSVEVFYDADHPDVFIHIQQAGGLTSGPAPNTSQVLLLTTTAAVNGFTLGGSLYRGSGYWGVGQDIPQPLSDLNVVGYGDAVFIIGGLDLDAVNASNKLYKYDPVVSQYYNLSDMPEPRTQGGADILGGSLYYVAGLTDPAGDAVDTTLAYNISADSWTTLAAQLSSPRSDHCVAAVNGSLYVAGGYSAGFAETLNLAERYNPNSASWTPIASMPTPRGDVMCAAMNGLFVVAGGFYDPTGNFTPSSFRTEVEAYSPASGQWVSLAPLPVARGDAAMTVIPSQFGDRLIVMGGESQFNNEHTGVATHQVQEYSSALNEWTLKAPMITPRFRHDCAFADGSVNVFGGASSSVYVEGEEMPTLRPVASVEEFFDTDNPDVFVYVAN